MMNKRWLILTGVMTKRLEPEVTGFAERHPILAFSAIILAALALVGLMAGLSFLLQARQQQAQATLAAGATATLEFLEFHYQKGLGYVNLGRWRDAQAEFELIFETDPNYKDVQVQLGQVYAHLAEAEPTLTPAVPRATVAPPLAPTARPVSSGMDRPAAVRADGLLAYYPFDGNANDESGNRFEGQVIGATLAPDRFGRPDRAYYFNGQTDYIRVNVGAEHFAGDFTIVTWVNFDHFKVDYPHILVGDNYFVVFSGTGPAYGREKNHVVFYQQDSLHNSRSIRACQIVSISSLNPQQWYHVAVIRQQWNYTFFINGVPNGQCTAVQDVPLTGSSLYIGANIPGGGLSSGFLAGFIDDLRLYERALSEVEIQALVAE